ncbi:hypothetical protein C4D60_Mb05t15820 [Musa balbisiana]|uniref:Uncharacterized protein n=1 Tax=Musa balbisiana TaxID=52838 RepID=A0A4V4H868_MUSBA|nr:hypothetical protein C4D60_Mb05t15820 [Musa balbisiana]
MWRSRRKRDGGCRGGLPRATAEEKKRESDNCTTWLYMFVCMLICHESWLSQPRLADDLPERLLVVPLLKHQSSSSSEAHNLMICGSKSDANALNHTSTLLNSNSEMPAKAIVFSQWTSMLDLHELSLNECLIQYRRLDGTMPHVSVMLMSLKAGILA